MHEQTPISNIDLSLLCCQVQTWSWCYLEITHIPVWIFRPLQKWAEQIHCMITSLLLRCVVNTDPATGTQV